MQRQFVLDVVKDSEELINTIKLQVRSQGGESFQLAADCSF